MKSLLSLILILIIVINSDLQADNGYSSIKGKLIDIDSKEVISNASLVLVNTDNKKVYKTISDLSGNYEFKELPGGNYQLNAKRIGYDDFETDFYLNVNEIKILDIYLKEIRIETGKINVTASRVEQTLQKTPSSVSLVNFEDIQNKNKITFDQVLEDVQGVTVNRSSSINVSSVSIRGSSDVAGGGIGNRVLLLLDGRPSLSGDSKGALWALIPVNIIERTEVVKGAFSSLYGSSAIGGVVNVITKKPTYKSFTSFNLNAGFYERLSEKYKYTDDLLSFKGANLFHSNTLNKFSYLLNLEYKQSDGYAQQTDYNFVSTFGKLTYDFFSDRDLELTFQYSDSKSGYPHYWRQDPNKPADPYQVNPVYIGDYIKKQTSSIDLYYKAIPNSKSKYSSRFYYYGINSQSVYNANNPVALQYGIPGKEFNTYIKSHNLGNVSQVDYTLGDFNYLIGGFDIQWNIVNSSPSEILYGDQQQYNIGIFVQDQIDFIKDHDGNQVLSATLGTRFDYNKFIGGFEEKQFSPKLSLIYSPDTKHEILRNTSFRLLAGRAFRTPSIAELYFKKELFGGFDFVYNPNLKPEEMFSLEVGLRKQFKTRFSFDISAFFNLYNNLIQYVNIGNSINGPFQVQNIANSQVKGIEINFEYGSDIKLFKEKLIYGLQFDYSYIDARDLSSGRTNDFLPYKPKHLFNSSINLNMLGFNLNFNGRYVSDIDEVLFFKYEEPKSYFIINSKISKTLLDKYTVFFAINNITDEFYQELERIPAPNRNYNFGIKIDF